MKISMYLSIFLVFSICPNHSVASANSKRINPFDLIEDSKWINQNNDKIQINKAQSGIHYGFVLSFTNCKTLCPMIAHDLKQIATEFPKLHIYLISIRPDEDTLENLKKYLVKHQLPESQFEFIKSNTIEVRRLARVLDLNFSDSSSGGHIDHSTNLVVSDSMNLKRAYIDLTNGFDKRAKTKLSEFFHAPD